MRDGLRNVPSLLWTPFATAGLFSATQTEAVEALARAGLRNPVRVNVAVTLAAAPAPAAAEPPAKKQKRSMGESWVTNARASPGRSGAGDKSVFASVSFLPLATSQCVSLFPPLTLVACASHV